MALSIRELLEPWTPDSHNRAVDALGAANPAEVGAELLALSRDSNPTVRPATLRLAAAVAPDLGDDLALALLADPVGFVRWTACEELLFHWCYRAAGPLAELLVREPDPLVRNMAVCALRYLGDQSHLPQLEAALAVETGTNHEGTPIREGIARSIAAIRSRCSLSEEQRQAKPGAAPDPAT
jgi:HEAT repeat protein